MILTRGIFNKLIKKMSTVYNNNFFLKNIIFFAGNVSLSSVIFIISIFVYD